VNGFRRTLFNHIHRKNDPDNCLSQNFIPNIITQDDVIPQLKLDINVFTSSTYLKNVSCMTSYQWQVSRLLKHCRAGILEAC
jgi:hypothetical protein